MCHAIKLMKLILRLGGCDESAGSATLKKESRYRDRRILGKRRGQGKGFFGILSGSQGTETMTLT